MKPEKFHEQKGPELKDNEKAIFDVLSKEGTMGLNELKEQVGLSNKKWDKGLKALKKYELVNVVKRGDEVFAQLIE